MRTWLGKIIPYVGFLEEQVEELRLANHRLTDQLLKATGNEPIHEPSPPAPTEPIPIRTVMRDYLRRLEAEQRAEAREEEIALAKGVH